MNSFDMSDLSPKLVLKRSAKSAKAYVPCKTKYRNSLIDDYGQESSNFHGVNYQGFRMPGSNPEPTHDTCGNWGYRVCQNISCHPGNGEYAKRFRVSCFDAYCPVCKDAWLHRQAKSASEKLKKFAKKYKMPAKHVVWSPDTSNPRFLSMGLRGLRKACRADLKASNFKHFMMIFHMYRDKMIGDKKAWYPSPHFHMVGFGWVKNTKEVHQRSGAVVVNLGVRDSIYNTISYQLSHASIRKGLQTVTWSGDLSYNKAKVQKTRHPELCPYCNYRLVVMLPTDVFKPPCDDWKEGMFDECSFFVPTKPYVPGVN